MFVELPKRGTDDYGSGDFGAPRGNHTHNGIDYACMPGTRILATCQGKVTKLGHPYEDKPETPNIDEFKEYDYVEVTDRQGHQHRYFYVEPAVEVGETVMPGTLLGTVQDLGKIYGAKNGKRAITNHVHYEIKQKNGPFLNPDDPVLFKGTAPPAVA